MEGRGPLVRDQRILVVGAGALGCEILLNLVLVGFRRIDVVDMDTIELTNLNRQLLFKREHIGKNKAQVAIKSIMKRSIDVNCTSHTRRIEEMPLDFFTHFHLIFCTVDNLETRLWLNGVLHEISPQIPMIEAGTEGWMGHIKSVVRGESSCLYCIKDLYGEEAGLNFPICTLAGTPSKPEHCVEWALSIAWPRNRHYEFDHRNETHIKELYNMAVEYATSRHVNGVSLDVVRRLVVRIIPNIISTTSMVAGFCVLVAFHLLDGQKFEDDFWFLNGQTGLNRVSMTLKRNPNCPICGKLY